MEPFPEEQKPAQIKNLRCVTVTVAVPGAPQITAVTLSHGLTVMSFTL